MTHLERIINWPKAGDVIVWGRETLEIELVHEDYLIITRNFSGTTCLYTFPFNKRKFKICPKDPLIRSHIRARIK